MFENSFSNYLSVCHVSGTGDTVVDKADMVFAFLGYSA